MRRVLFTSLLLGLAVGGLPAIEAQAEPLRVALIVANGQYASLPALARCAPSAATMRDALRSKGFEVIERNNLGRGEFDSAIGQLARRAAASPPAAVALYYCGYAVEFNSRPFVLPTSVALARDHDVLSQGIIVKSIVDSLRRAPDGGGIVLLDLFTPAGVPLSGAGRVAEQVPASPYAIVAANNEAGGDGPTAIALGLRDQLAAGSAGVAAVSDGLYQRLTKGQVAAQFVAATQDAAFAPDERRAPAAPAVPVAPASPPAAPPPAPVATPAAPPPPEPPKAPTPQHVMVDEDRMTDQDRRHVQAVLAAIGYYSGRVDGTFGPETRAAIRRYQFEIKAEQTGRLTAEQATRLVNGLR
jgi:hypothetical protein